MLPVKYKRVAIIGGGPAGLAAAKALGATKAKFEVDLFERSNQQGGLWYYTGDKYNGLERTDNVSTPNLSSNELFSPMYKYLETNIVSELMEYADCSFPTGTFKYPTRQEVFQYLKKYTKSIPEDIGIHLKSNILSLTKKASVWKLIVENIESKDQKVKEYDAVIVANGHFDMPFIPDVEGLNAWHKYLPRSITHAKYFDDPQEYANKNVLVVGSSSSGTDIAVQASVMAKNVYVSNRSKTRGAGLENLRATIIGLVTKYNYGKNRSIITEDGETVSDIDVVIFCTGYLYSFPFLKSYMDEKSSIITNGDMVHELYKHIFYIPDPSLVFMAIPKLVVPMPLAESQAAVISRVFSGDLPLPDKQSMSMEYSLELLKKGDGKNFHNLKFPADADYCHSLQEWIDHHNLRNVGLQAPIWDEQKYHERSLSGQKKAERLSIVVDHANRLRADGDKYTLLRN